MKHFNYNKIIPYCLVIFIAFYQFYKRFIALEFGNSSFEGGDYYVFYSAGIVIFTKPHELYSAGGFYYLPSFALFFGFTFSLIPSINLSGLIFYCFNIALLMILINIFDNILLLLEIKDKKFRLFFTLLSIFGFSTYMGFFFSQAKFIVAILFLFVIEREIKYRKLNLRKDIKFYIINFSAIIFSLSITPYFIFLLIIYLFNDIKLRDLFNKDSLKLYFIFVFSFFIQNIHFIIHLNLLIEFIQNGLRFATIKPEIFWLFEYGILLDNMALTSLFSIVSISVMLISTILLMFWKSTIEEKFFIFMIIFLTVSLYARTLIFIIIFPILLIFFIERLKITENIFQTFKKERLFLLAFSIYFLLYIMIPDFTINKYLSITNEVVIFIIRLRYIVLLSIFISLSLYIGIKYENRHINEIIYEKSEKA